MSHRSVAALWRDRVRRTPAALAFEYKRDGNWSRSSFAHSDAHVRRIAAGLLALGMPRGARVAILAQSRVEWIWLDFGVLCAGGATTTVYPTSPADDAQYILQDAACFAVFVEDAGQREKVDGAGIEHVFVIDGDGAETLAGLEAVGARFLDEHPGAVDETIGALRPDDLATLIYTSGTTGKPKGVMLTHDNWLFQAEGVRTTLGRHLQPGDKQYLFLPLAHSFGKVVELIAVDLGVPTAIDADPTAILAGLAHTKPTLLPAVPRVFEKIHQKITSEAAKASPRRRAIFDWALRIGLEVVARGERGERVGLRLGAQMALADQLVFRRLRNAFGGRLRAFASGGAPLSPDIARFFQAAGMVVVEGYGMTETAAAAVTNRFDDFRFGTVGKPIPGCEVAIAPDGEVLMRGRNVMRGYWNRPEATAEAIDTQGWLHSGDLGRIDPDGRLVITGRKKDLIITSGGKNVAPSDTENRIKASCPLLAEIVMVGDRRPYCVALVWFDPDLGQDFHALANDVDLQAQVHDVVARVNETLPSYAAVKKLHFVDDEPLTQASGLLTPSLKVKRAIVSERYRAVLDALYAG